jgi:hypothetical protein
MKNIKTFNQLFESSINDGQLKIFSFGENEFDAFRKYCDLKHLGNWDRLIRSGSFFREYAEKYGKFYIINDLFLMQYEGETVDDIKIRKCADTENRMIFELSNICKEIGCPEILLKIGLIITKMIPEFSIDLNHNIESTEVIDYLSDYFKKNPLEIHMLADKPELKKEVLDKTGIKDYGRIGKMLKHGLI